MFGRANGSIVARELQGMRPMGEVKRERIETLDRVVHLFICNFVRTFVECKPVRNGNKLFDRRYCKCCSTSYHGFSYKKCGDRQILRLGNHIFLYSAYLCGRRLFALTTFIKTPYFSNSPFLLLYNNNNNNNTSKESVINHTMM